MSIWTKIVRWWYDQDAFDQLFETILSQQEKIDTLQQAVGAEAKFAAQASFLLSQAPLRDAPDFQPTQENVGAKFAYVHPATFSKFMKVPLDGVGSLKISVWSQGPKSTRWVLTPLLPEGTVIYSPNQMPGLSTL